ncbi:unnamed protein product [Enterobius vermicularis]|uniref:RING-type domain-containing protein n=1 Tax=Enterobius vermicularis TaxID=51028 RepID=A0A0N4VH53_ENTVE|nr:unnamed protein product [Enterobius vermicularis]
MVSITPTLLKSKAVYNWRIKETDLLAKLKTEEGRATFVTICQDIAANQALLEDFILSVKERVDENSRNLALEAESISKALADISALERRKRDDHNTEIVEKLKEERGKLLMLYEQVFAEKEFRRKQLYMDVQSSMAKEEEEQRRIVADCLRRYAELMAPPVRVPVATSQKSKILQYLGPFSILFSWKKRSEKSGKKGMREKSKSVFNSKEKTPQSEAQKLSDSGDDPNRLIVARYEEVCVGCLDNMVQVLIFPCGHVCLCEKCASKVENCPLCRVEILRRILLSPIW